MARITCLFIFLAILQLSTLSVNAQLWANKQDSLALADFYRSINKTVPNLPVRNWGGVALAANGDIISLSIALDRSIPEGLSRLTHLQTLTITGTGTIPADIGTMTSLVSLILGARYGPTVLTGSIPDNLGSLSNLKQLTLSGQFTGLPAALGNLSSLTHLTVTGTQTGGIPVSFGNLSNLKVLVLSQNGLSGTLPESLGQLTKLDTLDLSENKFTGVIPESWSGMASLTYIRLYYNELTGNIPASFGNLGKLKKIELGINRLSGAIPATLGNCANLEYINLYGNLLSGEIPSSLGSLSKLTFLELWSNQLTGSIPASLGNIAGLTNLHLGRNKLTGPIPASFSNLQQLYQLDLADNQLNGPLPANFGNFPRLSTLQLGNNQLSGTLPASMGNMPNLTQLQLDNNQFTGPLPASLGNLTLLTELTCTSNQFSGALPASIGNLVNLYTLNVSANQLSGPIPETIGNMVKLRTLNMQGSPTGNRLSGALPASIGNLSALIELNLSNNQLSGPIPVSFSKLTSLTKLLLFQNQLSGSLPPELGQLTKLAELRLNDNQLSGPVPASFGGLKVMNTLVLTRNKLSGTIPAELGDMANMGTLDLRSNQLTGPIPASLGNLTKLISLNLDSNNLSGKVPASVAQLPINFMYLNYNRFNFDDLEETAPLFKYSTSYSNQQPLTIHQRNDSLFVSAGGTLANNTYYWIRNKSQTAIITADSGYRPTLPGRYTVNVYNKITKTPMTADTVECFPKPYVDIYEPPFNMIKADGGLFNEPSRITLSTKRVVGAAADGLTKLLLVVTSPKPVTVSLPVTNTGTLSSLADQQTKRTEITVAPDGEKVYFVYTTPDGFGSPVLPNGKNMCFHISYADDPASGTDTAIRLVAPPVVMVHGMWSGPEAWSKGGFRQSLVQAGFNDKSIFLADYHEYGASSFKPGDPASFYGRNAVKKSIEEALAYYRNMNYSICQVDVVAHSLGGLMTRSLSQQSDFKGYKNYYQGPVHKLITIGTPHRGSPLGPVLSKHRDTEVLGVDKLENILKDEKMPLGQCHIDFGVESDAVKALTETLPFKVHAITADYLSEGNVSNENAGYAALKLLLRMINEQYDVVMSNRCTPSKVMVHDLIVPDYSQRGYLTAAAITNFRGTSHSIPGINTETKNQDIQQKVAYLLATQDAFPFAQGFPAASKAAATCDIATQSVGQDAEVAVNGGGPTTPPVGKVTIAQPAKGAVISNTTSTPVQVTYTVTNAMTLTDALLMIEDIGWYEIDPATKTATFSMPAGVQPGRHKLVLITKDDRGNLVGDSSHIIIAPTGRLDSLRTDINPLRLDTVSRTGSFMVQGYYSSDGKTTMENLTAASTGTTYAFRTGGVATVSPGGQVMAVKPGQDSLIIVNGGQRYALFVTVDDNFKFAVKYANTLSFPAIGTRNVDEKPFAPGASLGSGDEVVYSVSGPAQLVGGLLQFTGAGKVTITASHPGNAYFNAAVTQTQTFCVSPAKPVITQKDGMLVSSAGSGNQWYLNNVLLSGATGRELKPSNAGSYTVKVTVDGCVSTTSDVVTFAITAVNDPTALENTLRIYPNPVDKELVIAQPGNKRYHVLVYTATGQVVYRMQLVRGTIYIPAGQWPAGSYWVVCYDEKYREQYRKLVFKK